LILIFDFFFLGGGVKRELVGLKTSLALAQIIGIQISYQQHSLSLFHHCD
jgi:hypothetical protein